MASNGVSQNCGDADSSLEKIKRQLSSGSGRNLLQGPLLKRSETLRKWNERWMILDPTTARMEYKMRRSEPTSKGKIIFDVSSTIALSPVNFHGLPKYEGCCFYIGTPQKKDYFLCAETPGATKAWVSTLHAAQLVLKAHREAVNSLSGNSTTKLGTVATVVAAANSVARQSSKEIEAAMKISMKNALGMLQNKAVDEANDEMDALTIMKETLRVKDEELQNMARDIRARDSTIKEIAEKLSETAEAASVAASAAHKMDEQRLVVCAEIESLRKDSEKQLVASTERIKELENKVKENQQLTAHRDAAVREANLWRSELAKAREHAVILEATIVRTEEKLRLAEARINKAVQESSIAIKDKQELLTYITMLQGQLQRQQVFEDPSQSKHVDSVEENVDKACLSLSGSIPVPGENIIRVNSVDSPVNHHGVWNDIQAPEEDVREITPEIREGGLEELRSDNEP